MAVMRKKIVRPQMVKVGPVQRAEMPALLQKGGFHMSEADFNAAMGNPRAFVQMRVNRELVPIASVGARVGLGQETLRLNPNLPRFRVGDLVFVEAKAAEKFVAGYVRARQEAEEKRAKAAAECKKKQKAPKAGESKKAAEERMQAAKLRAKQKRKEKAAKNEARRKAAAAKAEEIRKTQVERERRERAEIERKNQAETARKAQSAEMLDIVRTWKRSISHLKGGRKKIMLNLINANAHLTPKEFGEKIGPLLRKLLMR